MFLHLTLTAVAFGLWLGVLLLLRAKLLPRTGVRRGTGVRSLPKIAYYTLLNEYLVFLAWIDLFRGSYTVLWDRAESTRT